MREFHKTKCRKFSNVSSRAKNSKNAQYPGTGIGLALSKEIVNLHHGVINVESKPDQGSVFYGRIIAEQRSLRNPSEVNFYVGDTVTEIEGEVVDTEELEAEPADAKNDLPTLLRSKIMSICVTCFDYSWKTGTKYMLPSMVSKA